MKITAFLTIAVTLMMTTVTAFAEPRFLLPKDATITQQNADMDHPFFGKFLLLKEITRGEQVVRINQFNVLTDVYHVDALQLYADAVRADVLSLQTQMNVKGTTMGKMNFEMVRNGRKLSRGHAPVYMAVGGNKGYLITGKGSVSAPLVDFIAHSFDLSGTTWGAQDQKQTVSVGAKSLEFPNTFSISELAGSAPEIMVHNGPSIDESTTVFQIVANAKNSHADNQKIVLEFTDGWGFSPTVDMTNDVFTRYTMTNNQGSSFDASVATIKGYGAVMSFHPARTTDQFQWMQARFYLFDNIRALSGQK